MEKHFESFSGSVHMGDLTILVSNQRGFVRQEGSRGGTNVQVVLSRGRKCAEQRSIISCSRCRMMKSRGRNCEPVDGLTFRRAKPNWFCHQLRRCSEQYMRTIVLHLQLRRSILPLHLKGFVLPADGSWPNVAHGNSITYVQLY